MIPSSGHLATIDDVSLCVRCVFVAILEHTGNSSIKETIADIITMERKSLHVVSQPDTKLLPQGSEAFYEMAGAHGVGLGEIGWLALHCGEHQLCIPRAAHGLSKVLRAV